MECTSYVHANSPEDSGLGESQNESNPCTLFTPTTTLTTSRKRKINLEAFKSISLNQISTADSVDSSPWLKNFNILSSTMNDSITTDIEKCKLDSFAGNFYVERSEFDNSADTSSFLNNIREPSTPEKYTNKKYCNNISSSRVSPMLKLGSPERNEILYSKLPNSSRFSDNKRSSPAKKCLFSVTPRQDPVTFFCKERSMSDLMYKIFLFLSDENLYTCSKVSKDWKKSILAHEKLKLRYQLFIQNRIMNKENNYESPLFNTSTIGYCDQFKQSTPIELVEPTSNIYEVTNSLSEGQHLEKCICCNKSAVVDKNISQCINCRCGAIRCLKCNSISTKGPENFIDKCEQSRLVIEKPLPRYSLLASPKRYQNENGLPTILLDESINTSRTFNSSGYVTDPDLSLHPHIHSSSFTKQKADMSQVLKTCNTKVMNKPEKNWERRNSVLPVVSSIRRKEEIIEPSSPPKVKHIAGTKRSKKMLKRLNW